jgi:hypothetical protein
MIGGALAIHKSASLVNTTQKQDEEQNNSTYRHILLFVQLVYQRPDN